MREQQSWFSEFLALDLNEHGPSSHIDASLSQDLVRQLREQHLMILHGADEMHLRDFARHLAVELRARTGAVLVLEWHAYADALALSRVLSMQNPTVAEPAIFIAAEMASGETVEWLFAWQETLQQRGQYLVLTTLLPRAAWPLARVEAERFWRELPAQIYDTQALAAQVQQVLSAGGVEWIDDEWSIQGAGAERTLAGSSPQETRNGPPRPLPAGV
jgi:hypothetical protein